jgi:inner membrane protein involved in colicin E2 resistance
LKKRSECDELRTFESKQLQAGMRTEHLRQIEEKICKERHRLQEEAVFADLWQQDYEAKTRKEDDKKRQIAEKNKEMSLVLKEQMQVLEDQRQEEKRLRNENIRLIVNKKEFKFKLRKKFIKINQGRETKY